MMGPSSAHPTHIHTFHTLPTPAHTHGSAGVQTQDNGTQLGSWADLHAIRDDGGLILQPPCREGGDKCWSCRMGGYSSLPAGG